ncbi:hypothetical protein DBV15_12225 [Temnothorax longispinosus]|uniref:THAP-type domain-containing protein n=1 Tax=Temnothorax longispinosus TaxID=300112 RepID=A0A4S2KRP1_9HYME|nr:hypothetical protein DBV15_12225 [Temnothorax longispinosus]
MPSRCTALRCSNNSDDGYTLVTYPRDELLKQQWIAAVGRGKNWSPTKSQKLCEVHFKPSEIIFVAKRKCVKPGAVPSRFCTCPSGDQANCPRKIKKSQQGITKKTKNWTDMSEKKTENLGPTSVWLCANLQTINQRRCTIYCGVSRNCRTNGRNTANGASEDLLRSIIEEDERLRNKIKGTVEEVIKVNKKTEEIGVQAVNRKLYEKNWLKTLQRSIENISFEPGLLTDIFALLKEMGEHLDEIHKFCCLVFDEMSICEKIDFDWNSLRLTLDGPLYLMYLKRKQLSYWLSFLGECVKDGSRL